MQFTHLRLENIRSHILSELSFPQGVVLLAGDIGSGKSSILQAVEFALFGIRRGDVAGEGLLRHGEQTGTVTLQFTLASSQITVSRTLKRVKDAVRQDTGFLEIDGEREELTAFELKARIFELLGYPQELVSKRKGFVYRYTVYAAQERMKQIIYESDANRLDVLRSVFDIEKYKRVSANTSLLIKDVRDRIRYLEGQTQDLPELVEEKETLAEQETQLQEQLQQANASAEKKQEALQEAKSVGEELEEAYEQDQKRREKLAQDKSRIQELQERHERLLAERKRLKESLSEDVEEVDDPQAMRKKLQALREKNHSVKAQVSARIQSLTKDVERLQASTSGVVELDTCPTCKQPVTQEHKHDVKQEAKEQQVALQEEIDTLTQRKQKAQSNLDVLKKKESALEKREQRYKQYLQKKQAREHAKKRVEEVSEEYGELEKKIKSTKERIQDRADSSFDKEAYLKHRKQIDALQQDLSDAKTKVSSFSARIQELVKRVSTIQQRIDKKQTARGRLEVLAQREQWLNKVFSQAVSTVERLVFSRIHQEFSAKFTQWFEQLLADDGGLFADLDSSFAPRITQDGYDVELASLSGGEKQSVALAYRLALNNVVNAVVRSLKTSDVLVLDEPTDGFSDQQLDRVRDVLTQLPCEQVLVVSHEQKMQSFVDHVLHVVKRDGVSVVE